MMFLKLVKILDAFVPEKWGKIKVAKICIIKEALFIELYLILSFKVATLQKEMEQADNQSMVNISRMKTSSISMNLFIFQWLIAVQKIPIAPNSLSLPTKRHDWIISMFVLEK